MSNDLSKTITNKKGIYIFGVIYGVVISIAFMLIFAAILLFLNIDRAYAAPFATISVAVGCFFASRYVAKKNESKGYLAGLIIGGIVFAFITLLSLILGNGFSINTLFHFIIILLASLSGGIVGVNSNKNIKYI